MDNKWMWIVIFANIIIMIVAGAFILIDLDEYNSRINGLEAKISALEKDIDNHEISYSSYALRHTHKGIYGKPNMGYKKGKGYYLRTGK